MPAPPQAQEGSAWPGFPWVWEGRGLPAPAACPPHARGGPGQDLASGRVFAAVLAVTVNGETVEAA